MIFNDDPLDRMYSDLVLGISVAKAKREMGDQEKRREEVWSADISNKSNMLRAVLSNKRYTGENSFTRSTLK